MGTHKNELLVPPVVPPVMESNSEEEVEWSKKKVDELKEELKERGLSTKGKKKDLVERLEKSETNPKKRKALKEKEEGEESDEKKSKKKKKTRRKSDITSKSFSAWSWEGVCKKLGIEPEPEIGKCTFY